MHSAGGVPSGSRCPHYGPGTAYPSQGHYPAVLLAVPCEYYVPKPHAVPDQESQRLYSVAPLVLRKALGDVRVGQYTIPAGTAILIHVFAMHNTSANYERHAEFLPVSPCSWRCGLQHARQLLCSPCAL